MKHSRFYAHPGQEPRRTPRRCLLGLVGATLFAGSAQGAFLPPPEPPRFEVPKGSQFPLQATEHTVVVVGPIAYVTVNQVYVNEGDKLIDAEYIFPGSPHSAVASLVMKIGERTVHADLRKKEEARKIFEQAKEEGYRASLLEQDRPNIFRMALTNIRPGEKVEVALGYTELLQTEDGLTELALPALVAPRFGKEADQAGYGGQPPPTPKATTPSWTADITLADGLNITEVSSPTHKVYPSVDKLSRVYLKMKTRGEREFVLRWRVTSESKPEAGLTLFEQPTEDGENFFMMTVAPPKRIDVSETPPRELAFVLDVSGSMRGYPLDVAKTVMKTALSKLRPDDKFNILFFAGGGWMLSQAPLSATAANIDRAMQAVSSQSGGGGTQLVDALEHIANAPRAPGLARTIIVVTDGLVSFEKRAFAKVRSKLDGTSVFTLGIGHNINRMLVEGLARAGGGASYVANDQKAAQVEADRLLVAVRSPVLTGMSLKFDGFDAYDVEPPVLPDLYGDRPVVVVGKYRGKRTGSVELHGFGGNRTPFQKVLSVGSFQASAMNAPLRVLWARRKLQRIADDRYLADGGATASVITDIGLKYGLLTNHTSFVAVDSEGGTVKGPKESMASPSARPEMKRKSFRLQAAGSAYGRGGSASQGISFAAPASPAPPPPNMRDRRAPVSGPKLVKPSTGEADSIAEEGTADKELASPWRIRPVIAQGGLTSQEAEGVVLTLSGRLSFLGDRGRVTVDVEVGADGKVSEVKMLTNTGVDKKRLDELRKLILQLKFPAKTKVSSLRITLAR